VTGLALDYIFPVDLLTELLIAAPRLGDPNL
jgi:hypothetical protein